MGGRHGRDGWSRRLKRSQGTALAMLLVLGAAPLRAAAPPPADVELLEFLGSLDEEEEDWREFLAERPADERPRQPERDNRSESARKDVASERKPADDKVKKP